jgi:hypothetical protein
MTPAQICHQLDVSAQRAFFRARHKRRRRVLASLPLSVFFLSIAGWIGWIVL